MKRLKKKHVPEVSDLEVERVVDSLEGQAKRWEVEREIEGAKTAEELIAGFIRLLEGGIEG
jgi:hypothetical protein